jgi:hypothetical protein
MQQERNQGKRQEQEHGKRDPVETFVRLLPADLRAWYRAELAEIPREVRGAKAAVLAEMAEVLDDEAVAQVVGALRDVRAASARSADHGSSERQGEATAARRGEAAAARRGEAAGQGTDPFLLLLALPQTRGRTFDALVRRSGLVL